MLFYLGQPVDAYAQPPPGPWDIPAKTPSFFVDDKQVIKVPYTSSMKVNNNNTAQYTVCLEKKGILALCLEIFFPDKKHFIHRPATLVWEWGENLAKTVPVLVM